MIAVVFKFCVAFEAVNINIVDLKNNEMIKIKISIFIIIIKVSPQSHEALLNVSELEVLLEISEDI